jgi:predicted ATPase
LWGCSYTRSLDGEALARCGYIDQSVREVGEALDYVLDPEVQGKWALAEILRIKGAILAASNDAQGAEDCFQASLDWAREQQAKSWELRSSISLARLWRSKGKRKNARDLLKPIYDWFTEGFETKDLKEAMVLLNQLRA